jgi:hypothetical protein
VAEIIVVVDGCDDGSLELLEQMRLAEPRVRPIWRENGGENAARQTGVEAATGDVVLMIDDDVTAGPGLAAGHARVHASVPDAVVVGYMPTTRPTGRRPGSFTTALYADDYEKVCRRYERDPSSILLSLWGGNVSLRRADALRVGLAGPQRLGFHDDQEFGLRCARSGLAGVFDRSLRASHAHVRDVPSFLRQARAAGRARRLLGQTFPDLVPDVDPTVELTMPLRAAIRLLAADPGYRWTSAVLRGAVNVTGSLGIYPIEGGLGRVLRQVEVRRGFCHG